MPNPTRFVLYFLIVWFYRCRVVCVRMQVSVESMAVEGTGASVFEMRHDRQARRRLETKFARLGDPRAEPRLSLALAEELRAYFSSEVRAVVRALRDCPDSPDGVIIRNAGRDPSLPATPLDAIEFIERESHVGEWILLVLASSLGTVVSYREQRSGQLFNNIVPMPGSENEVSSQGCRSLLGLHRECTFSEVGPDFIGLYCHRGGGVGTYIVSAARLQRQLTDKQWHILRQPRFVTPTPPTFCRGGLASTTHPPHPIFIGERDNPEIRVDATLTRGSDPEAEATLEELRRLAWRDDILERVALEPGDVLFLNNRKCLHGREAFEARFDGADRWLVRLYVKSDIWPCRDRLVGDYMLMAGQ
jgi:L-asparagine oxygenase